MKGRLNGPKLCSAGSAQQAERLAHSCGQEVIRLGCGLLIIHVDGFAYLPPDAAICCNPCLQMVTLQAGAHGYKAKECKFKVQQRGKTIAKTAVVDLAKYCSEVGLAKEATVAVPLQ